MDPKGRALGSLLFHLLIVLGTFFVMAMETNASQLEIHGDDVAGVQLQEKQEMYHHSQSSSHHMMNHVDPRLKVFFLLENLQLGKKMTTYLDDEHPNPLSSPFLLHTKKQADAVPFSLKQLPDILRHFSFPQGSLQARVMREALRHCESMPMKGERKFCATSYESLVNFARQILGFDTDIQVLSTTMFENSKRPTNVREVVDYTIVQITEEIAAPRTVSCHPMRYPYEVINCHSLEGGTDRLYRVSLEDENGGKIEAIAICHMDTSQWSPDHVSFQVLGIKPGIPVCHFFPISSFVLVPSTTISISSNPAILLEDPGRTLDHLL